MFCESSKLVNIRDKSIDCFECIVINFIWWTCFELKYLGYLFKAEEEEEQYKIAGGVTTTAEPRPNAYIPDHDSQLPIPRPYGKHAPFKPAESGSTMRHIRKPVPKPIEI